MRPEQIPYGVKNFKRIRLEDFYYVDKTAFIRTMEERANFLFFVRPRRFGKSLLCETLRCYYDVAEKGVFSRRTCGRHARSLPLLRVQGARPRAVGGTVREVA